MSSPSRKAMYSVSVDIFPRRKFVFSTIHLFGIWCHALIFSGYFPIYSWMIFQVVSSGESSPMRSSQSVKDWLSIESIVYAINFSCLYVVVMMETLGIRKYIILYILYEFIQFILFQECNKLKRKYRFINQFIKLMSLFSNNSKSVIHKIMHFTK